MKSFVNNCLNCLFILLISSSLFGCVYKHHKHNKYHIVRKGETLYSIARKHHVRLENLAKINFIKFPYRINKGQKLFLIDNHKLQRLSGKTNQSKPVSIIQNPSSSNRTDQGNILLNRTVKFQKNSNKPATMNVGTTANTNKTTVNNIIHVDPTQYISTTKDWVWPANGRIIKQFAVTGVNKGNGIDIAGKRGDPVTSIANGKVVYSGNNLRGYGNLVIIKHNQDFLSAYAHNEKILVTEQQEVKKGQQIATMGDSGSKEVLLHFEIRFRGKPVDPVKLLVKR